MNKQEITTVHIHSITQLHQLLGMAKPKHPLFSLVRFEDFSSSEVTQRVRLISDCYQITLKKDCPCKLQYGQTTYDFDEGVMSFFSPKQINIVEPGGFLPTAGWLLTIHPDFLTGSLLAQRIRSYGFFNYSVNEALILSDDEQSSLETIFELLQKEINLPIDTFSQDVILSHLDLLLTYSNRYYNRQFVTRKIGSKELLNRMEHLLDEYFSEETMQKGMPTVSRLASQLNLSPKYLSDCLKQLTGQTALQHIHEKLIDKAKEKLAGTELSVSEIAYHFGFEFPQSFSKLFKSKTRQTPLEYRQSVN